MSEISKRLENDPEFAERFRQVAAQLIDELQAKADPPSEMQLKLEEIESLVGRFSPNDILKCLVPVLIEQNKQIEELKYRLDHVHDPPVWV